jgi:periplasmic protein CpxP/Spy
MSDELSTQPQHRPSSPRRWLFAALIGVAAIFGFAAGNVHSSPFWHWHGHHNPLDAEEITFIVQHRIDRVLSKADATQEQRDKVHAIVKSAVDDVMAMRKDTPDWRGKALGLFTADTIDRSAVESLRADRFALADAASKRIVKALTDVAEVLKPEQRKHLAALWEERHMHP